MREITLHRAGRRALRGLAASIALVGIAASSFAQGTTYMDNAVVSNSFHQVGSSEQNYFTGDLGVGTNSPASKLHVAGGLRVDGALTVPKQGDVEMGSFTNGASSAGSTSQNATVPVGYISGCWARYLNATQVVVQTGDGYCNGNYFHICATSVVTVAAATSNAIAYVYVDDDASSYPTNVAFYASTNAPEHISSSSKDGWYLGDDRNIDAMIFNVSGTALQKFETGGLGRNILVTNTIACATGMLADATWKIPNIKETSVYLPVNAAAAYVCWYGYDQTNRYVTFITTKEATNNPPDTLDCSLWRQGYDRGSGADWIELGPSRQLRIAGEADDNRYLYLYIKGWQLDRVGEP